MENIALKADYTSGITGQLPAADFNDHNVEQQQAVTATGQTLTGSALAAPVNQLAKAMFLNGTGAQSFIENTPVNNGANLTPMTGNTTTTINGMSYPTSLQVPDAYAEMNGMIVTFYHSIPSTTNSLTGFPIQIGQSTSGYLSPIYYLLANQGGALSVGSVSGNTEIQFIYNLITPANSYWQLLYSDGTVNTSINAKITGPASAVSGNLPSFSGT